MWRQPSGKAKRGEDESTGKEDFSAIRGYMIRAIDMAFLFPNRFRAHSHMDFGVIRDSGRMHGWLGCGAMLDDGKLPPSDIAPICTIWWL